MPLHTQEPVKPFNLSALSSIFDRVMNGILRCSILNGLYNQIHIKRYDADDITFDCLKENQCMHTYWPLSMSQTTANIIFYAWTGGSRIAVQQPPQSYLRAQILFSSGRLDIIIIFAKTLFCRLFLFFIEHLPSAPVIRIMHRRPATFFLRIVAIKVTPLFHCTFINHFYVCILNVLQNQEQKAKRRKKNGEKAKSNGLRKRLRWKMLQRFFKMKRTNSMVVCPYFFFLFHFFATQLPFHIAITHLVKTMDWIMINQQRSSRRHSPMTANKCTIQRRNCTSIFNAFLFIWAWWFGRLLLLRVRQRGICVSNAHAARVMNFWLRQEIHACAVHAVQYIMRRRFVYVTIFAHLGIGFYKRLGITIEWVAMGSMASPPPPPAPHPPREERIAHSNKIASFFSRTTEWRFHLMRPFNTSIYRFE